MLQSPIKCLETCNTIFTGKSHSQFLGFQIHHSIPISLSTITRRNHHPRVSCSFNGGEKRGKVNAKGKDNVWSVDNDMAKEKALEEKERERRGRRRKKGKGKRVKKFGNGNGSNVMVSGSMLMEVEDVLQTQEPVIRPAWHTFVSSVSGIWKGVGAVFSPTTAEMEPVDTGSNNDYLYDCYTLSRVQAVESPGKTSQIQRKINWVTLNPHGEKQQNHVMPKFESFNFGKSDLMEEDVMGMEPGLVFFEDGSYSRGPVEIPVGDVDESNYYLSPTYKFEQCLVKGCHKRLRIVHTVEFSNGGADIQILRLAVYEEQWVGPANFDESSEVELDVNPFSQRKRIRPSELTGPWKVFEVSATPIYGDDTSASKESNGGPPYVYLCMEAMKKRSLPENPAYFGEEEMLDMQDVAVLWLPGGVTAYVDVNNDGILCVGVGWYSDEGVNLVMERDYETDGKLREVRWKTEVKRRWPDSLAM